MATFRLEDAVPDPPGPTPEVELVERIRQGDHEAFEEFVKRYEKRVFQVIRRYIYDATQAEDLTQEVFLKAFRNFSSFNSSLKLGPWLFKIAVNVVFDFLRKKRGQGLYYLFSQTRGTRQYDPIDRSSGSEGDIRDEVRHIMELIPEPFRAVLVLKDLEGFSTAEIATILDRKEGTVRWHLSEGRLRFQTLWTRRIENHGNSQGNR